MHVLLAAQCACVSDWELALLDGGVVIAGVRLRFAESCCCRGFGGWGDMMMSLFCERAVIPGWSMGRRITCNIHASDCVL
jgi:hypothetical protein